MSKVCVSLIVRSMTIKYEDQIVLLLYLQSATIKYILETVMYLDAEKMAFVIFTHLQCTLQKLWLLQDVKQGQILVIQEFQSKIPLSIRGKSSSIKDTLQVHFLVHPNFGLVSSLLVIFAAREVALMTTEMIECYHLIQHFTVLQKRQEQKLHFSFQ